MVEMLRLFDRTVPHSQYDYYHGHEHENKTDEIGFLQPNYGGNDMRSDIADSLHQPHEWTIDCRLNFQPFDEQKYPDCQQRNCEDIDAVSI